MWHTGVMLVYPITPEREGYDFISWDKNFTNVKSTLTITSQYEKKRFVIIFKDYDRSELKKENVYYGKTLLLTRIGKE